MTNYNLLNIIGCINGVWYVRIQDTSRLNNFFIFYQYEAIEQYNYVNVKRLLKFFNIKEIWLNKQWISMHLIVLFINLDIVRIHLNGFFFNQS